MIQKAAAGAALAISLIIGAAANAGDPYVTCVQRQLETIGHDPGPIDGLMGQQTRAAWSALTATLPDTPRLSLLPALKRTTAIHWCREIAFYDTSLGRFMPSREGHLIKTENKDMRMRFVPMVERARRFFRSVYQIEIAGRVGIALGKSPKSIARDLYAMSSSFPLRLRGVETDARSRCAADRIAGAAYPDRAYVCLPWLGADTKVMNQIQREILIGVYVHEFAHLIEYELSGFRSAPWEKRNGLSLLGPHWIAEGAAEIARARYSEEQRGYSRLSVAWLHATANSSDTPLRSLRDIGAVDEPEDYQIALYAMYLLTQRNSPDAIFDYWRHIGAGKSWNAAFQATFGMELGTFETEFETLRADVKAAQRFVTRE